MGKKTKHKEKNKDAINKSKDVSVKKSAIDKLASKNSTLKARQKALVKQWKALRKQHTILETQYQGMEKKPTNLLEQIPQLQLESQEIKGRLAAEIENTVQVRDRLDSLEVREGTDQERIIALNRQMELHLRLLDEVRNRLEAVAQLASQGEHLKEQIEYLQAGKAELVTEVNGLKSGNSGLESSYESLSTRLDDAIKRLDESVGKDQVMETWIENLNRADSDLSLQMGQQHERIQELVEQAEKLDKTTHKSADSYHALQEQVRDLRGSLTTTEERLVNKDAELEKESQHLDSEHQHLAAKHGRLAGSVFGAVMLLLVLGGIGYSVKFASLDQTASASSQQIERISERMEQQERKLVDQEQRFSAANKKDEDSQWSAAGELDAKFARINQSQDAMEASLKGFTEKQDAMDKRLEQTRILFAELTTEQAEWQTVATQQTEKLRLIEERLQGNQTQIKVAGAPATANVVLNSNWLQGLNPKHYTIQILAAYDAVMVSRVAAREDLRETMAIYKGKFNQRDWHILLYGDYSSVREARSAIQDLPEDIRAHSPWVRNLSTVQEDLAEH